ncbi:leucine-rich repeat-containing protein 15-like [Crotalus adamanteus]|uniref:Leucine-rich repeat-containing protein 15-like n=1 Tax=Crotalus adamanteus TaxID=8729 RepID=A0AAW1BHM1_CROAD
MGCNYGGRKGLAQSFQAEATVGGRGRKARPPARERPLRGGLLSPSPPPLLCAPGRGSRRLPAATARVPQRALHPGSPARAAQRRARRAAVREVSAKQPGPSGGRGASPKLGLQARCPDLLGQFAQIPAVRWPSRPRRTPDPLRKAPGAALPGGREMRGERRGEGTRSVRGRPRVGSHAGVSFSAGKMALRAALLLSFLPSVLAGGGCPLECSCSRTAQVECSGAEISEMPAPLPGHAMSLQVVNTRLAALGPAAFGNASQLLALRMEKNLLERLSPRAFRPLAALRYLSLASNRLQELPPDVFRPLARLEALLLSGNQLRRIQPAHFAGLSALKELQLHGNRLQALPPGAFDQLPNLARLNLARNQLVRLPPRLFTPLARLQVLRLYENQLAELAPRAFDGLGDLQELALYQNRLRQLPAGLFAGPRRLQKLLLSGNLLGALPEGLLLGLPELSRLSLFGNALRQLRPGTFGPMPQLRELRLGDNQLASLPGRALANLTALQVLVLSRNRLGSLAPTAFAGLEGLEELALHSNRLATLDGELLRGLSSLRNLSVHSNRLAALPAHLFQGTPGLRALQLQNNSLEELPAGIFDRLPELRDLQLHDNPWRCDSALRSLRRWLRESRATLGGESRHPRCAAPPGQLGRSLLEPETTTFGPGTSALPEGWGTVWSRKEAPSEHQPTSETLSPGRWQPPLDSEPGSAEIAREFPEELPEAGRGGGGIWGLTRTQTGVVVTCLVVASALLLGMVLAVGLYSSRRKRSVRAKA